ncbi:hypothetical protein ZOD2009_02410 [Haladaptatus paucihalophilus DX253]|uniref:LEA14-like dessication related protein n=1 Tax=Haladaptatus paucihalophilus DX253 TaxID=797209 RepID=E7QNG4_HALPU|nr:LEA type 2 family protein [Haladaptatus paucihalophilus]EFW93959.1 hypothetical protein ZOD2009_02410 [Haladaptatus paucihalophilus DX253]SHK65727.1 LEA14-like dessication related protein [Haladaptatus paucihalophilus DX253]
MAVRSLIGKLVVAVLTLFVVTAGGVGVALTSGIVTVGQPTVENVQTDWGAVTAKTTEIRTDIAVNNPSSVGVPKVADLDYEVGMNEVTVATGTVENLGLPSGQSTVSMTTRMDNRKIPAWWATHINNGEKTTVSIRPSISVPMFSKDLPAEKRAFETDLLSAFDSSKARTMTAGNREILRVTKTEASWGHATTETTPLNVNATVENPTSGEVVFSELGYTITMNNVTVADGTTDGEVHVEPGRTTSFGIDSTFDNGKLPEWWQSHIEHGEKTTMDVQFYAVVHENGTTRKVGLPFMSKRIVFTTDVLGGGKTTTKVVPRNEAQSFAPPELQSVQSEWVVPDEGNTGVRTHATVTNPNEPGSVFAEHLSVDAKYRVLMNDVPLVDGKTTRDIGPGKTEINLTGEITDEKIQRWWATHVNNGEKTDRVVERDVTVDAGFARLPVGGKADRGTIRTDMLGPVDSESSQTFSVAGRPIGRIEDIRADWGHATMDETPIEASATVKNDRSESVRVVEIGSRITMNGIVLSDESTAKNVEISPHSETTIQDTVALDNAKLGPWWKTHLRRGEESTLEVSYYVVVEYRGHTQRIALDSLNYRKTVRTNVLGNASA